MRSCQLFSLAVVALSFVSMTGCAHAGLSQATATGLTGENAPIMHAMKAAGASTSASTGYTKHAESPIAAAMNAAAQGGYTKKAQ